MLRNHLKHLLCSPLFWSCSVFLAAAMLLGIQEDLSTIRDNSISLLYCWIVTNSVGIAHVLLPVLATVPFTFYFTERMEKKTIYYALIRSGIRKYYLSDILAAILSTALVTLFASLLFLSVCGMLGAGNGVQDTITDYFSGTWFALWCQQGAYHQILMIYMLDYLLYSLPWAILGMIASLFCKNKYVVIAMPFIGFMLLSYLTELLPTAYLNPNALLLKGSLRSTPGGGILYAAVYFIGLSGILGTWYYLSCRRHLKYEGI